MLSDEEVARYVQGHEVPSVGVATVMPIGDVLASPDAEVDGVQCGKILVLDGYRGSKKNTTPIARDKSIMTGEMTSGSMTQYPGYYAQLAAKEPEPVREYTPKMNSIRNSVLITLFVLVFVAMFAFEIGEAAGRWAPHHSPSPPTALR
jgi:hypothetical protein